MHSALIVWSSLWLGATPAIDPPASSAGTALVAQLGSSSYAERQSAMEQLWAAGDAAIPLLESALRHKSAEIRHRAQFVLDNLRTGITHDTPNSILREVHRFRSDMVENRRRAMQRLETAGRPRIVLALMQSETDPRLRDEWSAALERSLIRSIAAGQLDEVAETLRRSDGTDQWSRHWAAFALQRGMIDAELARPSSVTSENGADRQRIFLLRAKGDLAEAARLAQADSEDLRLALLTELRDWKQIAPIAAARVAETSAFDVDPERIAFAAAAYRLVDLPGDSDRYLDMLQGHANEVLDRLAKVDPSYFQQQRELVNRNWHFAKGLLLNGRYDQAIDLMRTKQAPFVFELLCEQYRFEEAFAAVGSRLASESDPEWFRQIAVESSKNQDAIEQQFAMALFAIRQLMFLGRRDEAFSALNILLESAHNDRDTRRLRMVCETALKLSATDLAFEITATILDRESSANALGLLFPSRASMAAVWWDFFRATHPHEATLPTLRRLDDLFHPSRLRDRFSVAELIDAAAARAEGLKVEEQSEWWHQLAETARLYGRDDLAAVYYTKTARSSNGDALRLGDLFAAKADWVTAAQWYHTAWRMKPDKPLPLYLHGRALQRSGNEEPGKELAERALLMPMAHSELRHELASGMKERGYRDEARQQFEIILRTGDFQDGRLIDAAKQLGNLVHTTNELRAADCWETMLLCCLKPHWVFVEKGGYVQIPYLVHKTRARGLLKSGQPEAALKEAWAAYRAAPANSELAEEFVPLLQAANRSEDAKELFAHSANRLRELSESFPQCGTFHNNIAWLYLRCGGEMTEALEHAERATSLEPNRTAFVDTLGEIHFRLGQLEQAIACAERCLKADSQSAHYHAQIERYRNAMKDQVATKE